jgi:hypothetical protein
MGLPVCDNGVAGSLYIELSTYLFIGDCMNTVTAKGKSSNGSKVLPAIPVGIKVVKAAAVVAFLHAAIKASGTVTTACRNAASAIAADLVIPVGITTEDAVKACISTYGAQLVDSNIKAIFTDCLWLALSKDKEVSFVRTRKVKGKDVIESVKVTGTQAVAGIPAKDGKKEVAALAKHDLRAAVKSLRDSQGVGRAPGAGRKPNVVVAKATPIVAGVSLSTPIISSPLSKPGIHEASPIQLLEASEERVAFAAWLDNIAQVMKSTEHAEKVVARFREVGYKLVVLK